MVHKLQTDNDNNRKSLMFDSFCIMPIVPNYAKTQPRFSFDYAFNVQTFRNLLQSRLQW